jgi:hypothetical protein
MMTIVLVAGGALLSLSAVFICTLAAARRREMQAPARRIR